MILQDQLPGGPADLGSYNYNYIYTYTSRSLSIYVLAHSSFPAFSLIYDYEITIFSAFTLTLLTTNFVFA